LHYSSIVEYENSLYVANRNVLYKFTGISWEQIGTNIPYGEGNKNSLAFDDNGIPYIIYCDESDKLYVIKYE
jgi:hypothetical protein